MTLDGADLGRVPVTSDAEGNAAVTFSLPRAIQRGDGLLTVLVDDGGVTLHDLQLALYPEGGDLVAGLPGRVYFAAKTPLDKPADGVVDPLCCTVPEREFAQPSYGDDHAGPRTDFRETVAWRSRLTTDARGKGELVFTLSDAVTSFKVTAEGTGAGRLGHGEALVQSKKPVSLAVKLPLEVSAGDHLRLPVTVANDTDQPYRAELAASFGKAFAATGGGLAPSLALAPRERRSPFYELDVVGDGREAGEHDLAAEVDRQRRSAATTRDPYLLALASNVLVAQAPGDDATRRAVQRLAAMQAPAGAFPGADHSITRSGGEALAIETTSLAALALMAAGREHAPAVRSATATRSPSTRPGRARSSCTSARSPPTP